MSEMDLKGEIEFQLKQLGRKENTTDIDYSRMREFNRLFLLEGNLPKLTWSMYILNKKISFRFFIFELQVLCLTLEIIILQLNKIKFKIKL
jgi:hypothetical protein